MHSISSLYNLLASCDFQIVTDSRKITPGCIYWGLRGEKFDGSAFALQAIHAGAAYAVVEKHSSGDTGNPQCIAVEDSLFHLQQVAHLHRNQFHIPVIAICGSNGKTTTKELLVSVLKNNFQVHYTQGNLNNHIGVPLTLLKMRPEHTISVIEIGANHLQEVYDLCTIACPTHGLICSIGKDHLEGYGSVENVAKSNEELFMYLCENKGFAWVNAGDPYIANMKLEGMAGHISYAGNSNNQAYIEEMRLEGMRLNIKYKNGNANFKVQMHIAGAHNSLNALSVTMIADTFGVPEPSIIVGLSDYVADNNRSQVIRKGDTFILLDAYNANPTSVEAAIRLLQNSGGLSKAYILGDMFELGEYALQEHRNILELVLEDSRAKILVAGPNFSIVAQEYADPRISYFQSTDELIQNALQVQNILSDVKSILIKGSRSMQMERVLSLIPD